MTESANEAVLALHIRADGLPEPVREHRFCRRRWRFDFAWPDHRVAVEVEGGYGISRHRTMKGYTADCEKYAEAALLGWTVLRFTPPQIKSGYAIDTIKRALAARTYTPPPGVEVRHIEPAPAGDISVQRTLPPRRIVSTPAGAAYTED